MEKRVIRKSMQDNFGERLSQVDFIRWNRNDNNGKHVNNLTKIAYDYIVTISKH